LLETYAPILLYTSIVLLLAAAIPLLSWVTGGRHSGAARNEVYESGIIPTGGARVRFPVRFYMIALFFLIFDLELAFIFLWAAVYQDLAWQGYLHVLIFVGVLLLALLYPWMKGALDFVPRKGRP
jgi:NADH-quinone oxidoreductase subunit A